MVGLLQQPDARRGGADRELGDDRRPRARRRAGAGQASRSSTRSGSRRRSTRSAARRSIPATETRYDVRVDDEHGLVTFRRGVKRAGRAAAEGAHSGDAAPHGRAARRGAPLREGSGALPGARRDPRAAAAGALPLRPGPAGLGQDVHRRAPGGRADEGGPARRRHRAQPQGDPQVPGGGRERRLRVPRAQEVERAEDTEFEGRCIDSSGDNADLLDPELQLIAGTSFLFSRPGVRRARGHAVRRRGRADCARRRARGRDGGAEARPARRPEPARRRSRRARIRRARARPCSGTCSARTRPCARRWASSSSRPGGCGPR